MHTLAAINLREFITIVVIVVVIVIVMAVSEVVIVARITDNPNNED